MVNNNNMASQKVWNSDFVDSLNELETISKNKGEMFRARAYKTASDTILAMSENIYDVEQLKDKRGIGKTIFEKLKSLVETGKINAIEREKSNVLHQLCKIYGVGPKKALDLSNKVSSIEELKSKQDLLNDKQKIGLFYFEDIQKRIPRAEIEEYDTKIQDIIKDLKLQDGSINAEIVGSFRRGALSSGDIDIIFTSDDPKSFSLFLEKVSDANMILAYLSKGSKKSLTIGTLGKDDSIARRILGLSDILGLVEKAQKNFNQKNAQELEEKIISNQFNFNDFSSQLKQFSKLGSLAEISSFIPGLKKIKNFNFNENQFKWLEAIIGSMTNKERENPSIINGSRRARIAKGSGRTINEVNRLIKQFNQLKSLMKKTKKMKLGRFPFKLN